MKNYTKDYIDYLSIIYPLNIVPFSGEIILECEEEQSKIINNPTWLDIIKFADQSILDEYFYCFGGINYFYTLENIDYYYIRLVSNEELH